MHAVTKTISVEFARKKDPVASILLDPGTVDTDLSRPFERNVPANYKLFTKELSMQKLLNIINNTKHQGQWQVLCVGWTGNSLVIYKFHFDTQNEEIILI